ncbi:hypothetical protein [Enterobacter chuandaensis]|uniref:Sensory transduction regulator n=1 Tax=Enterobacter chuandaensis TaxID=2497875 RepID=A0AA96LZC1_9ENTR|nr:hypothetical protein [Enterobacter chuandaensis]MCW4782496.1 hypothetical protein [Enterobacter chuandaensis]MDA4761762.1 hypothetical protein [Enterobacter chuandaensis]WNS36542.1 hypothetical protein RQP59_15810 [Enterobacter chuandaensis]
MELLNLNQPLVLPEILKALARKNIKSEIDDDGDILIDKDDRYSIIRDDDGKIKFFGVIIIEKKYDNENLEKYVSRMNFVGENLRFTVMDKPDGGHNVFYSTSFPKTGCVDDDFFVGLINSYLEEVNRFVSLMDVMDDIIQPKKEK